MEVSLQAPALSVACRHEAGARGGELLAGVDVRERLGHELGKLAGRRSEPSASGSGPTIATPRAPHTWPATWIGAARLDLYPSCLRRRAIDPLVPSMSPTRPARPVL